MGPSRDRSSQRSTILAVLSKSFRVTEGNIYTLLVNIKCHYKEGHPAEGGEICQQHKYPMHPGLETAGDTCLLSPQPWTAIHGVADLLYGHLTCSLQQTLRSGQSARQGAERFYEYKFY